MDKEVVAIVIGVILVSLLIVFGMSIIRDNRLEQSNYKEECENYAFARNCILCANDCDESDYNFIKYKGGNLFTNSECWCNDGNRPTRIW